MDHHTPPDKKQKNSGESGSATPTPGVSPCPHQTGLSLPHVRGSHSSANENSIAAAARAEKQRLDSIEFVEKEGQVLRVDSR